MNTKTNYNLISYIAPGAPATRRPSKGNEPWLRPEIGFTPRWYHECLGVDFGEKWHTDPAYRKETVQIMRGELRRRFAGTSIGQIDEADSPADLLTGTYGASTIAAIYGIPILYKENNWPNSTHQYLDDAAADNLVPPDLDKSLHMRTLLNQVDWIAKSEGKVIGYINWQGVLNNAQRLRGQPLFLDMILAPERVHRLADCVTTTMISAARLLYQKQAESGEQVRFFTISNCLVNMISAAHYREFILPYDRRIAEAFGSVGIHNCAWNANPYMDDYATVPGLGYVDMGHDSDLPRARDLFPKTRRAIMYTPMDVANKSLDEIRSDLTRIAIEYGPCDIVAADIESATPDQRVLDFINICTEISKQFE